MEPSETCTCSRTAITLQPTCSCEFNCICSDTCLTCKLPFPSTSKLAKQRPKPLSHTDLSKMRIVQRCLVYVIGLSPTLMTEEAVCSKQFFGQYGSIVKCVVKRSKPKSCPAGLSYGGYITFSSELEAALCIEVTTTLGS
mmetsp:Transcript_21509/g.39343  ORF Transcript_21509/g.39343 Transcript_21509/m.39343 type:complete len:140 (+) Transcript_21509:219-638(+)